MIIFSLAFHLKNIVLSINKHRHSTIYLLFHNYDGWNLKLRWNMHEKKMYRLSPSAADDYFAPSTIYCEKWANHNIIPWFFLHRGRGGFSTSAIFRRSDGLLPVKCFNTKPNRLWTICGIIFTSYNIIPIFLCLKHIIIINDYNFTLYKYFYLAGWCCSCRFIWKYFPFWKEKRKEKRL